MRPKDAAVLSVSLHWLSIAAQVNSNWAFIVKRQEMIARELDFYFLQIGSSEHPDTANTTRKKHLLGQSISGIFSHEYSFADGKSEHQ